MAHFRIAALAAVALAAACTSSGQHGAEVMRYHNDQPIPAQPIEIRFANPKDADNPQFRTYASIVATELANIGFATTELEDTELIAVLDVLNYTRDKAPKTSPVSIGIGGGSYGKNVGVGVGTSIPVGKSSPASLESVTELQVNLARRSDNTFVWEGRALSVTEPEDGDQATVVKKLAMALFKEFPGKSGRTVKVN